MENKTSRAVDRLIEADRANQKAISQLFFAIAQEAQSNTSYEFARRVLHGAREAASESEIELNAARLFFQPEQDPSEPINES